MGTASRLTLLRRLTNARPSSIYRLRPLQGTPSASDAPGRLGIQIQPLSALEQLAASLPGRAGETFLSQADAAAAAAQGALVRRTDATTDVPKLAEKIVKNVTPTFPVFSCILRAR